MPYRPATLARHGVVCAPHYLASQAGLSLLQAGGNAVDAAIAANAVLNVVYPILCGLGGDLFMLIYD
ncbi:MAG TPA: gamma-glutamyltransferase, partial [Dehalococcoidia bacterium]|nr:gamma-glutamyltransferase [Dehalococcoidia bacterium]